jgi:DNA-binding CsgD family transcriptional regulator
MLHSLGPGRIALDSHRLHSPIVAPLLKAAEKGEPLRDAITQIIHALGFDSFMYGVSMSPRPGHEAVCYVYTTLPDEWIRLYDQMNFIEADPRLLDTFDQSAPFIWDQRTERNRGKATATFLATAIKFGIASGVTFGLSSPRGGHAIVAFNSKQPYIDESRLYVIERLAGDLYAVATYIHDGCVREISEKDVPPAGLGSQLSDRQRRCILMTAHGYRNRDIAERLKLHDRTVEDYLSVVRSKLGAVSTLNACTIALDRGLIRMGEIPHLPPRPRRRQTNSMSRGRKSAARTGVAPERPLQVPSREAEMREDVPAVPENRRKAAPKKEK